LKPTFKPAPGSPRQDPPQPGEKCTHTSDSLTEQCTFIGLSRSGDAVVITADAKIK
jgi:hypothetical protein